MWAKVFYTTKTLAFIIFHNSLLIYSIFFLRFSDSLHISISGCPCHSLCASNNLRSGPSCQVKLESCSNRSTILVEPESVEYTSSPNFFENLKPTTNIKKKELAMPSFDSFFNSEQISNFYNVLDAFRSFFQHLPDPSDSQGRNLEVSLPSLPNMCECKEDFMGIWDYCVPSNTVASDFQNNLSSSLMQESDNKELLSSDLHHLLWSTYAESTPPHENLLISHTTTEGCHPSCSSCLTSLKDSEYGCVVCKNNSIFSHVLVHVDSRLTHGLCLPVTTSRTQCHNSCTTCLATSQMKNEMGCVSCPLNYRLVPPYVGKCILDTFPNRQTNLTFNVTSSTANVLLGELPKLNLSSTNIYIDQHRSNVSHGLNFKPKIQLNEHVNLGNPKELYASSQHFPTLTDKFKNRNISKEENQLQISNSITFDNNANESIAAARQAPEKTTVTVNNTLPGQITECKNQFLATGIFLRGCSSNYSFPQTASPVSKRVGQILSRRTSEKQLVVSVADPDYCKAVQHYIQRPLQKEESPSYPQNSKDVAERYWTQLVYLQADNNLQSSGLNNLDEMLHPVDEEGNENTERTTEWKASDFVHLVVLLDTRQKFPGEINDDVMFFERSSATADVASRRASFHEFEKVKQNFFKPSLFIGEKLENLLSRLVKNYVVCPKLSITDKVSHHNIDQTKGEAYELYRIRHYDILQKTFLNEYRWLLLRRRGEVDMNDPDILSDFISRSLEMFPSRFTSLVFWNHGAAWRGLGDDKDNADGEGMSLRAISNGLKKGLQNAQDSGHRKVFSLIGFDACTMNEFTVVEEISKYCQYFLASENYEPARGWNWRYLNPTVIVEKNSRFPNYRPATPLEYATYFIRGYMDTNNFPSDFVDFTSQNAFTLSLIEISAFQRFSHHFDMIFELLFACGGHRISQSIREVMNGLTLLEACLQQKLCGCVDMGEFLNGLIHDLLMKGYDRRIIAELLKARDLYVAMIPVDTQLVQNALTSSRSKFISSKKDSSKLQSLFSGISLYFPFSDSRCSSRTQSALMSIYYRKLFNTSWSRFLNWIIKNRTGKECLTYYPLSQLPFIASNPSFTVFPLADGFVGTGPAIEVSSVNVSISTAGYILPKYSVEFSSWISGYSLAVTVLTGVSFDRVPAHLTDMHKDYKNTVLLTREIPYTESPRQLDKSSYASTYIHGSWDFHHFVLVQAREEHRFSDGFTMDPTDKLKIAPLYVSHIANLVLDSNNSADAPASNSYSFPKHVIKDVLMGYIKYYSSAYDIERNRYDFGCVVFKWPQKSFVPQLLVKGRDGWSLHNFNQTKGFIRPILYFTKAWTDLRVVRTTQGRLMTGAVVPRHVISEGVDSNIIFKLNSSTEFLPSVQKWEHSIFLQRLVFRLRGGDFIPSKRSHRAIVGFSARNMNRTKVEHFLFSVPDMEEEGYPFCVASHQRNQQFSRSNNGVCDILVGRRDCINTTQGNASNIYVLKERNLSLFPSHSISSFGDTIYEAEANDCWIQNTVGWLTPLMSAMPYNYITHSLHTDSSINHLGEVSGCNKCGAHTRCIKNKGSVDVNADYKCICEEGYKFKTYPDLPFGSQNKNINKVECIDIDECLESTVTNVCDKNFLCVNLPGSYACICNSGYIEENVGFCIEENSCIDAHGNGECLCPLGYQRKEFPFKEAFSTRVKPQSIQTQKTVRSPSQPLDILNASFPKVSNTTMSPSLYDLQERSLCTDIDECQSGMASCHPFAECRNLKGGYACICKDGYEGDGRVCVYGSPSVTVALRLFLMEPLSVESGLAHDSSSITVKGKVQMKESPSSFQIGFAKSEDDKVSNTGFKKGFNIEALSMKEIQAFFATALSQALGISQWRIVLLEPLMLLYKTEPSHFRSDRIEASPSKPKTSYKAYRCILRFLSLPSARKQGKDSFAELFGFDGDSHNFFHELSSYQIVVELKRQLGTQFHFMKNATWTLEDGQPHPLQNPKIVGEHFALLAKNMILDAYRIDEPVGKVIKHNLSEKFLGYLKDFLKTSTNEWGKLNSSYKFVGMGVTLGLLLLFTCYKGFQRYCSLSNKSFKWVVYPGKDVIESFFFLHEAQGFSAEMP